MNKKEIGLLACPYCKGLLNIADSGESLLCQSCQKIYQIKSGIPILIYDTEAQSGS